MQTKPISELVFTDHLWNEENQLVACTKSGELFTFQLSELLQSITIPSQSGSGSIKPAFTCMANFRGNGLAAGTEDGQVHFFKYDAYHKRFEFIRTWTCIEIKLTKVISMCVHEVSKDDLQMAIVAKSQNIVYLNIQKQIYARPVQQDGFGGPAGNNSAVMMSPGSGGGQSNLAASEDDFAALLT